MNEAQEWKVLINFKDKLFQRKHSTVERVLAPNEGAARSNARFIWAGEHNEEDWIFISSKAEKADEGGLLI